MEFEYDPQKSESNQKKHGISFEDAKLLWADDNHLEIPLKTEDEHRWMVIATLGDKVWSAIITFRKGTVRLISVRRSRDKEVDLYEG